MPNISRRRTIETIYAAVNRKRTCNSKKKEKMASDWGSGRKVVLDETTIASTRTKEHLCLKIITWFTTKNIRLNKNKAKSWRMKSRNIQIALLSAGPRCKMASGRKGSKPGIRLQGLACKSHKHEPCEFPRIDSLKKLENLVQSTLQ